jgi:hypothetical protein
MDQALSVVGLFIALSALVASIVSVRYTHIHNRRLVEQNHRLVAIEEQRRAEEEQARSTACITAVVQGNQPEGIYEVVVRNQGPGTATAVTLVTSLEHSNWDDGGLLPKYAIRRYRFAYRRELLERLKTSSVSWTHPSGEKEQRHLEVSS